MQTKKLAILIAYLAGSIFAPQASAEPTEAQDVPKVLFCDQTGFNPPCITEIASIGECITLRPQWADKVSSLQPNREAGICRFYKEKYCFGEYIDFEYPGHDNLPAIPGRWNDNIESYECFGNN
ncbi:uncharacterized protein TrAtP1_007609 [Trichoderma atroviride]|uniref:Uncharacterized protein n=1 Tax=Hypocrea atroviridis (strain ATCC 20476 / IMI 206040) TaxID=452589 RepID=G9NHP6_HYPAI|nr:uncharacterized protein TRIATDRAFT_94362 [Trichoderma atroviride IMI 206040]EHK49781.1 hypothetical protein TRIATDRAFT_94362 [Trichoderma atroviride IMI 206040]UKZ66435.1 hypothetical protein TrAtP1_007609 [Trichoderma atroviride]